MSDKPEITPKITVAGVGSGLFFTCGTIGTALVIFGFSENACEMMAWSAAMYAAGACVGTWHR